MQKGARRDHPAALEDAVALKNSYRMLLADQAEMFAKGEMKRVAFTAADVDAQTVRRYRPGLEP